MLPLFGHEEKSVEICSCVYKSEPLRFLGRTVFYDWVQNVSIKQCGICVTVKLKHEDPSTVLSCYSSFAIQVSTSDISVVVRHKIYESVSRSNTASNSSAKNYNAHVCHL